MEPDCQVAPGPRLTGSPLCSFARRHNPPSPKLTSPLWRCFTSKSVCQRATVQQMPHLFCCCCCCWPLWECDSSPVHHHNTTVHVRFHVSAEVFPQPVILAVQLHRAMSNVCLMGVGEASITLIVAHWVNFSYLENPSFLKCCECGGYDGRLRGKTKGWLASNTALRSGTTFMGFSDGADGHLKFGWRSLF